MLRWGLLLNPEVPISANPASQLALGIPCLCLLCTGVIAFVWVLGTQTPVLTLVLLTEPSPQPYAEGVPPLFLAFSPQPLDTHLHVWMLTPSW